MRNISYNTDEIFKRYFDSEIDLDSLSKLRAYRIQSFATWLASETHFSLIKIWYVLGSEIYSCRIFLFTLLPVCRSKTETTTKFEATITGVQSSNELIIQQLEELLKNDCSITEDDTSIDNMKSDTTNDINLCSRVATGSHKTIIFQAKKKLRKWRVKILFNSTGNSKKNKKAGILKTQSFLDKKKEDMVIDSKKHPRQNIALQTILKRNQEQEHKQVCIVLFFSLLLS